MGMGTHHEAAGAMYCGGMHTPWRMANRVGMGDGGAAQGRPGSVRRRTASARLLLAWASARSGSRIQASA